MMNPFAIGQRWISDTESDLGLGTIIDEELRQITVLFMATGDTRIYSKESAPLTRVQFSPGDNIASHAGWHMSIESVTDNGGTLEYNGHRDDTGDAVTLPESELNNFLQFRSPRDRLFAGLLDGIRWFALRRQVFEHRHALAHSPVRGLMGARVSLLPHQVYIAVEAAQRLHPRILLADEVGLGKTIEAGMILHSQLITQQVSRVLILVPSALVHQWLVEMLRKFNLSFSIIDQQRFEGLQDNAPEGNPFLAEQLVLCSVDTLLTNPVIASAAISTPWDMLITDEAHHLEWQPDAPSLAYELVEQLALQTPSVLLLTATPEQLGQAGHFARLRLLDPDRFCALDTYLSEETAYEWVADVANRLSQDNALEADQIAQLESCLGEAFTDKQRNTLSSTIALSMSDLGQGLIAKLIDRHGTGRLLFRNTRNAIKGFPQRSLRTYELEDNDPSTLMLWLMELLADYIPAKMLLICSRSETVQNLAELLRVAGMPTAQFHEGMSIVERDRAAAWFADPEENCRLLLCSEIGSEGRNFQFLHHLVTLELPLSPDLLEQRIGRLDRIGQLHDIVIHVPYLPDSSDHILQRWYHEGLNAFESICRTGSNVVNEYGDRLDKIVTDAQQAKSQPADLDSLISDSAILSRELETRLEAGRDRLLELNSNRPERIQEHLDALTRADRDYRLQDFMAAVFDRFGVNVEEQRDNWILHPSDHMHVEHFPHLTSSGLTVTFDRNTALTREDYTFLSWDHPMVTAAMDLILDEGYGQADCQVIKIEEVPKGLAFAEAIYVLQCPAASQLNFERYFPVNLQNFYVGIDGVDYTDQLQNVDLDSAKQRYDRNLLKQVVQKHRTTIEKVIDQATELAQATLPEFIDSAQQTIESEFTEERQRLVALQRVNHSVRDEEIESLDTQRDALLEALAGTHARPVSVRILFNN